MGIPISSRNTAKLEKNIREWDPNAFWKVTVWNREKYLVTQVQAGSEDLAKSFAIHALVRDGEIERNLSITEVKRVE